MSNSDNSPLPAPRVVANGRESAVAGALGGTPLAILSVMLWESYHPGAHLDPIAASAVGSVGATVFAFFWHTITRIIDRLLQILD